MPQVLTKAWTAALLNAVGDILAQVAVERNERLDLKRLGTFSFLVRRPGDRRRAVRVLSGGARFVSARAAQPGACPMTCCWAWGASVGASSLHARDCRSTLF